MKRKLAIGEAKEEERREVYTDLRNKKRKLGLGDLLFIAKDAYTANFNCNLVFNDGILEIDRRACDGVGDERGERCRHTTTASYSCTEGYRRNRSSGGRGGNGRSGGNGRNGRNR